MLEPVICQFKLISFPDVSPRQLLKTKKNHALAVRHWSL